jgi:hypothetical protein
MIFPSVNSYVIKNKKLVLIPLIKSFKITVPEKEYKKLKKYTIKETPTSLKLTKKKD